MGIDIYMRWPGQTEAEKQAQYTGFDITSGAVGYLREAYHGDPYVTYDFVAEAFDYEGDGDGVPIPAAVLRDRLAVAQETARKRYANASDDLREKAAQSYADFVALAERKEAETGAPVLIYASY